MGSVGGGEEEEGRDSQGVFGARHGGRVGVEMMCDAVG